jgi:vancomycin resistance protein YoaR
MDGDLRRRVVGWLWLVGALGVLVAALAGGGERELAAYSTSLADRTPNQRHNATLAARALDGARIAPGGELSFNRTVGPWVRARDYRLAYVSYGGEMVLAYGGGVCQTSSTLYNAALLAGLEVRERDHHQWAPGYVAPGLDAAVAQGIADLRLVNPYRVPVRVSAGVGDGRLRVRLVARLCPRERCTVTTRTVSASAAPPVVRYERAVPVDVPAVVRPGRPGCRVVVERLRHRGGRLVRREPISDDTYLALGPLRGVAAR